MGKLFALSVEELDQVRVFPDSASCRYRELVRGSRLSCFGDNDMPHLAVVLKESDSDTSRPYCVPESLINLNQNMAFRYLESLSVSAGFGFSPADSLPDFLPQIPARVNADCRESLIVFECILLKDKEIALRDPICCLGDPEDGPLAVRDFRPAALSADVLPPH